MEGSAPPSGALILPIFFAVAALLEGMTLQIIQLTGGQTETQDDGEDARRGGLDMTGG